MGGRGDRTGHKWGSDEFPAGIPWILLLGSSVNRDGGSSSSHELCQGRGYTTENCGYSMPSKWTDSCITTSSSASLLFNRLRQTSFTLHATMVTLIASLDVSSGCQHQVHRISCHVFFQIRNYLFLVHNPLMSLFFRYKYTNKEY